MPTTRRKRVSAFRFTAASCVVSTHHNRRNKCFRFVYTFLINITKEHLALPERYEMRLRKTCASTWYNEIDATRFASCQVYNAKCAMEQAADEWKSPSQEKKKENKNDRISIESRRNKLSEKMETFENYYYYFVKVVLSQRFFELFMCLVALRFRFIVRHIPIWQTISKMNSSRPPSPFLARTMPNETELKYIKLSWCARTDQSVQMGFDEYEAAPPPPLTHTLASALWTFIWYFPFISFI